MKSITTFLACLIGLCPQASEQAPQEHTIIVSTPAGDDVYVSPQLNAPFTRSTVSGNYLASRFAQRNHDWDRATDHINKILDVSPEDVELQKRSMVLGMGAGEYDLALSMARKVLESEPENSLASLFVAMDEFKNKNYEAANTRIEEMPEGSLSAFIMPLLDSWAQASVGVYDTEALKGNTIHIYHAILIADFLGQHDHIKDLLEKSLQAVDITPIDLERIADIYGHIGEKDKAKDLYNELLKIDPENAVLNEKISKIENNEDVSLFERVESAEQGISETMFDMARILYRDYSDESARIFAHLGAMLNPQRSDIKMLLGYIAARNDRFDEAIGYFRSIGPEDKKYFEARRFAANLLEEHDETDQALAELRDLVATHLDIDAMIQIGDVYRRNEQFQEAVDAYNKAQKEMGGTISDKYWSVHYTRGMSYEQLGDWEKAEEDLQKALSFQPEHPYALNYLGYSWADQGMNLKQALAMIEKAVKLRPQDGYITDSLGWVLYKMGNYRDAVPHLERAVELQPYDPIINDHLGDAY